jgi:predicted heme/steroid binding protein
MSSPGERGSDPIDLRSLVAQGRDSSSSDNTNNTGFMTGRSSDNQWADTDSDFSQDDYHDAIPVFTLTALRKYDGAGGRPMYVSIKGKVYDVSSSPNFNPDQGYGVLWGGRDATFSLAKGSLKPEDSNVVDRWDELTPDQLLVDQKTVMRLVKF